MDPEAVLGLSDSQVVKDIAIIAKEKLLKVVETLSQS